MDTTNTVEAFKKRIEEAFQLELKHAQVAAQPGDVPRSYDAIAPEWFTHILCQGHPDAKVVSYRAEKPDDLDRGHMRIRLSYNDAGVAAGLPASVFCKDSQKLEMRLFNNLCTMVPAEVVFYNKLRGLIDNVTPNSLFAAHDPRSFNSIIVFEDLLPQGAEFCLPATTITRERIESQLTFLAQLHGKFYARADTHPVLAGWRTFGEVFDAPDKYLSLEGLANRGFLASESVVPPRLYARAAEIWGATVKGAMSFRGRPTTFVHGDAHLRNWYIAAGGAMRLADWQLISRGDWVWDVTYTLSTSLAVENRRAWEKDLIRFYLDKLHQAGAPALDFNDAWDGYRRHLPLALSWWTPMVKHSSDFRMQPMDDTFRIIQRVATAIDDLDALDGFD